MGRRNVTGGIKEFTAESAESAEIISIMIRPMIKIMSFNLRTASASDGSHCWENRKQMVVERICAFAPDLIGVQECRNDAQAAFMQSSLPEYAFVGFERGGEGDTAIEMAPIFVKKASLSILEARCFWLSETLEQPGSSSWGSAFPRTVAWVRLAARQDGGRELYFFNTHFDYANLRVQVESARLLSKRITALEHHPPVMLCGDFNIWKDTEPYHTLLAGNAAGHGRLQDCYRRANPAPWGDEGTFHDFGALKMPSALDWMLASAHFQPVEAYIDRFRQGEHYPSDHYPLTCRCEW
jgi:endonuclease/exonuclease/phosphatase family metal-dependent hydrolase